MADKNEVRVGGIWFCKIGEHSPLQRGADSPMRDAVAAEYKKLTGQEPAFIFSGWGGELTEGERAVVENRLPSTPPADAALADDALCESLIEASDMRWNGDVYVGDGSDLMSLVRAALRARAVPEGKKYHDVAQRLYALLDDIDTAGDIAKSDDKLYRGIVKRTQAKKRDFVVSCDGYTVTLADDSMLAASKEGGTNG